MTATGQLDKTRRDSQSHGALNAGRARAPYAPGTTGTVPALGDLIRRFRAEYGLSTRRLAERAAVARSTVQRLERGRLRPRPSTLGHLAGAIDPDRRAEISGLFLAAAGDDVAKDNDAWSSYQLRRLNAGLRAGEVPLPAAWDRQLRLGIAGNSMWDVSSALLDLASRVMDDSPRFYRLLRLSDALRAESRLLEKDAGGILRGAAPLRRWKGDPADASLCAPPMGGLRGVWRWLWEWQCREGRLRPRSARERAVAETGARERRRIAEAAQAGAGK